MKKWLVFLLGAISGAIMMLLLIIVIGLAINSNNDSPRLGARLFDAPQEIIEHNSFEVFQALDTNNALVRSKSGFYDLDSQIYLLYSSESFYPYDGQIIKISPSQEVRRTGTYKYSTKLGEKTVPIISILDK